MSMFSGLFSRDPTSAFAYELVGEQIHSDTLRSLWTLYAGKKRGTGEKVSIFKCDLSAVGPSLADRARAGLKRLKTLRHPCILTYLDSVETDKVILIATEQVQPLESYLSQLRSDGNNPSQREAAIAWGLHQVATGLSFLNSDCGLVHQAMSLSSVYVNAAGVWRIGCLDYTYPASESPPTNKPPGLAHLDPPELSGGGGGGGSSGGNKYAIDSFGFGILIWETFNGKINNSDALQTVKALRKIPESLNTIYPKLVENDPKRRITHQEFTSKCREPKGFLNRPFIDAMLFLEQIQIKESGEKNRFFTNLDQHLETFPRDICKNKVLPLLIEAFEYGNVGSAILGPLFKIGSLLDETEYQQRMVPCIVKLFGCQDRSVRTRLLEQMDLFVNYLTPSVVNDQLFNHFAQGFVDSSPVIREQSVKCMLNLAPKLSYTNLNDEMLKHFARLQAKDEEGGIRTNTTICLGKIAHHLDPQVRQTVLIPAFVRVMKDPFPPARTAAIMALCATQNFYSVRDCATRVMPALCHLTMDPEKSVRDQALKALKGFMTKVEKVSEDSSLLAQMEADLNAAGSSVNNTLTASWAGWAVNSLTSKFYRSASVSKTTGTLGAGSGTAANSSSTGENEPTKVNNIPSSVDTRRGSNGSDPSPFNATHAISDTFSSHWDNESTKSGSSNATNKSSTRGGQAGKAKGTSDGWAADDDLLLGFEDEEAPSQSKPDPDEAFPKFQPDLHKPARKSTATKSEYSMKRSELESLTGDGEKGGKKEDFFGEWGQNGTGEKEEGGSARGRRAGTRRPMRLGAKKLQS